MLIPEYSKFFAGVPLLNEPYPCVIFLRPKDCNKFSKGKNSPKGTNLYLLYL